MGILLTILFIVLFFKLTGLFFRACGRILGIALKAIPLLLLIGIGATAVALVKN